ncbi:MAG TPA: calcium/sodium antiporter [Gammaproteobacteria bacterium]|nr:calcium/sodium antiporter [Gammaproteobacteria bacterium]HRP87348.1 calcium/sodium antiporter [Gammaproteobacteria bacterium]
MIVHVGFLVLGSVLLYAGGEGLVRGAGTMALRLGMSPFIIGITIVAFATSAPELAVSLQAALAGVDDVAIGNVVGSNIANIGLILGICAVLRPVKIEARILSLDLPWLIFVSLLLVAFLNDGHISRPAGLVLLAGLGVFLYWNIQVARREQEVERVRQEFEGVAPRVQESAFMDWVFIVGGLVALVAGGAAFVRGGVGLATALGVSPALIALTVIAVGTSLPELATSIVASLKGNDDIAVGNVIGSNFFNILAILGITAVLRPLDRGDITMVDLVVMLMLALMLVPLIMVRQRIGRPEGLALLAAYFAYIAWLARQA